MAVSNSTDYSENASTIIKDALVLCGGLEDDETPSAEQSAHALRALNRMVKAWSPKGLKAWAWNQLTLTLADGQTSYTIDPAGAGDLTADKPLEIRNARRVYSSQETPIFIKSRQEYMDQVGKDDDGTPIFIYYEPLISTGVIYVWQVPDASANSYTINFDARQYMDDFDNAQNDPYFPAEWLDALVYNLAFRLCPKYEVTGEDRATLGMQAQQFLMDAEDNDTEEGSVYLQPRIAY